MKTIFTVACEIPGGSGQYIDFDSKTSLLDADFVVFCPNFYYKNRIKLDYDILNELSLFQGKPSLSDDVSFQLKETMTHWQKELIEFLNVGKTMFLLMSGLQEIYVSIGEKEPSGTCRNQEITSGKEPLSNYDLLPLSTKIVESKGTAMILSLGEPLLKEYWQHFGNESKYLVYIADSECFKPLVITRTGKRTVGAIFQNENGGALVALPWPDFYRKEFLTRKYDETYGISSWTSKAKEWGTKYVNALKSLDAAIKSRSKATPTPQWARDEIFRTRKETELSDELLQIQTNISEFETQREKIQERLAEEGSLKRLLFEQGHELEDAILEAMELLGFNASNYRESDSEFDAVLECSEGRCIGEAEGRNDKPISIDKMRQLEINILEDLDREEVAQPAKGILFGNAYRLTPPPDRPDEHFTPKCLTAAVRNKTALIRTCDLFEVARVLDDNPDAKFAASCRQVIFDTEGEIVKFPALPERETEKQSKKVQKKTAK